MSVADIKVIAYNVGDVLIRNDSAISRAAYFMVIKGKRRQPQNDDLLTVASARVNSSNNGWAYTFVEDESNIHWINVEKNFVLANKMGIISKRVD